MRNDPKSKGERTEAMMMARLLGVGKVVLLPFGDNQRYDLVIDDGGKFIRVQCKTGRLRRGCVEFATSSTQWHRGKGKQDYRGQADVFGVFCPENEKAYLVPVKEVGRSTAALRLEPAKNKQVTNVRPAKQYEI